MDTYSLLKLVHILSATLLFGTGLGTAFFMWRADCSGNIDAMAVVSRNVVRADFWFTTPAVIIQPLTGFGLMHVLGIPFSEPWIVASLLLYMLVGCCWIPVVFIQMRVARLARMAADAGQPLGRDARRLMRWWYGLGWPAFISVVLIFCLMVVKSVSL
jgi:uncharacterized membrane protein